MARYYPYHRPIGYAQVPDGYTASESWWPPRKVGAVDESIAWVNAYGWVEYAEPLATDVAIHWSMLPGDPVERALFWLVQDHRSGWESVAESYREANDEALAWLREGERWIANVLRANPEARPVLSGRYGV